MTDAELFMKMRAAFRDAEAFVEAAADRIEAQVAEIERLEKACDDWADRSEAQAAEIERLEAKLAGAVAECERIGRLWHDAEAKLAKAQGALHQIAGKKDYADDPWGIARTTLAELKG